MIVLKIQRSNRKRVLSFKCRIVFMQYYWEIMKLDMSKVLLAYNKNASVAKKISVMVFAVNEETRDKFINMYS